MKTLYPHQREAVSKLDNGKILCGQPGVGKSLVAATYYAEREAPKDVYVITTARKRDSLDWPVEFAGVGVFETDFSGSSGMAAPVLTVDSWNNIEKYAGVKDAFFIFDEQRLVGSGAWVKSFIRLARRNNWILLSATPGDTWLDYIPVFVANGFYQNRTEFKQEHVIYKPYSKFPKVDRYVRVGKLVRLRDEILVDMPYERHTTRHQKIIKTEYDKELFKRVVKDRWHVYENRPLRDVSEMFVAMRRVVNSDLSRLAQVRTLMEEHPRLIVFYNFDYELEMLRTLVSTIPVSAPFNSTLESPPTSLYPEVVFDGEIESGTSARWPTTDQTNSTSSLQQHPRPSSKRGSGRRSTESSTSASDETTRRPTRGRQHDTQSSSTSEPDSPTTSSKRGSTSAAHMEEKIPSSVPRGHQSVQIAEWNGHKHEPVPTSKNWVYLVQYTAGSEAWNCIETNAVVFYSLTYSYKTWHQSFGRIDRLNTPWEDLYYYVLRSDSPIDHAIWKSLMGKKSFNEAGFKV